MIADACEFSDAVAFLGALLLDGNVYYFATLMWEECPQRDGDEEVYRPEGRMPLYGNWQHLKARLEEEGMAVEEGVFDIIDVDRARDLADLLMSTEDEIEVVLEAWNGFEDVLPAMGLPFEFRGTLANRAYDKLYWSMNYPREIAGDQHYTPQWRPKEVRKIRQLLRETAARLRKELAEEGAEPRENLWRTHRIERVLAGS